MKYEVDFYIQWFFEKQHQFVDSNGLSLTYALLSQAPIQLRLIVAYLHDNEEAILIKLQYIEWSHLDPTDTLGHNDSDHHEDYHDHHILHHRCLQPLVEH